MTIALPQFRGMAAGAAGGGGPTDPYFANVVLLCHFDGSNGATTATSAVGSDFIEIVSPAALSTAESVFGGASAFVNNGMTRSDSVAAAYQIGTSDVVFDGWVRFTALASDGVMDMRNGSVGAVRPFISINASGSLIVGYATTVLFTSSTGLVTTGTWYYIAWARTSTTARIYLGTSGTAAELGNWTDSQNYTDGNVEAGSAFGANRPNMYADDWRLSIGTNRGFTGATIPVPTAAFPNS